MHYLSFSSQWEHLQHDDEEPGQLKGMRYGNSVEACDMKCVLCIWLGYCYLKKCEGNYIDEATY